MFTFLQKYRETKENEVASSETRSSLAPRTLDVGDPSYHCVEELQHAISLPECKNIALTGVFGSGKSSVINTYLKSTKASKQVLRISLSNFIDSKALSANHFNQYSKIAGNQQTGQKDIPNDDVDYRAIYENEIEYKIFQQIIHKADYRKTSQSRQRRINALGSKTVGRIAFNIILFCVCFVIIFEPKFLYIQSFYDVYFHLFGPHGKIVNTIADLISAGIILVQFFVTVRLLTPKFYSFRIKSVKAKDCEVNFEDKEPLFSKWLDEILYFLKAGEYELVVFEDLDRIEYPQELFLKLREINILLNESDSFIKHNRIIRFVYAIKDDVFQNEVRTKFFDYIIPVVPVIDYFNSGEYLIKNCKGIFTEIDDVDLKQLGLYVSRMRDLLNIINEYQLYHKTIVSSSMSQKKLLAMIIYKNLYPSDYSYLHDKKGCLYTTFDNKQVFYKKLTTSLEENKVNTQEEINKVLASIIGMRKSVLDVLKKNHSITKLIIGGKSYTLDEVSKSKTLFESLQHNRIDHCIVEGEDGINSIQYNQKFNEIIDEADPDNTFWEQKGEYESQLEQLEKVLTEFERRIGTIRNYSLCQLMRKIGDGDVTVALVREICAGTVNRPEDVRSLDGIIDTIHSMARNGYITEDYSSYISYTYHGSISESEFNYLQAVIQGRHLEYDYPLNNISSFISNISSDNYSDRSILNFDLANYLFSKNDMDSQRVLFIQTARKYFDFIISYDSYQERKNKFYSMLFNEWSGCVNEIMSCNDFDIQDRMLTLYLREAPQSEILSNSEIDYLNDKYEFIVKRISYLNLDRIKSYVNHYHLRFNNLVLPTEESQTKVFYGFVVDQSHFTITYDNLLIIYGAQFNSEALSCILSGTASLKSYLLKNIQTLFPHIPITSKQENESALAFVVKNRELSDEQISNILSGQKNRIISLGDVPDNRYELVFKGDYLLPSWENIRQYFTKYDDLSIVSPFVNNHSDKLANEKLIEGDEQLQVLFLGDNETLSIESFKRLVNSCVFVFDPEEIADINEDRLEILLDNDLLEYSADYNSFMSNYSPHLLAKYIIKYFDEMINTEGDVSFENSNILGIDVLSSELTDNNKALFLKEYACLIEVEGKNEGLFEYARLICEFYHQHDCADADFNLITKALQIYVGEGTWLTKIELINRIHRTTAFNRERTVNMVNSLGAPYTELNDYSNKTNLDNNPQNNELVDYLREHLKFISNKIDKGAQIKVTYHHNPGR